MDTPHDRLKGLKRELHCNIADLVSMAQANDPFYSGSETTRVKAEWFADAWQRLSYSVQVHLRRIHYALLPLGLKRHDGELYVNTDECWAYLCSAASHARYLGLVDPRLLVDRRNPAPHIHLFHDETEGPGWYTQWADWELPAIQLGTSLFDMGYWSLPYWEIQGYNYDDGLQPYHIEIWCEKSTMDDVLAPICENYGANLVTGVGFMSITSVIDLLHKRAGEKPVRVLYISDFDPAGQDMPPAVGRQIEFWLHHYDMGLDIKLTPLALTREQVAQYQLPRTPIKEEDRRKGNFEDRQGEGAVELDALEGLHPGALGRMVEDAIAQFHDSSLPDKLAGARTELNEELREAFNDVVAPYHQQLQEIKAKVDGVMGKYSTQVDAMREALNADLAPYKDELDSLRHAIKESLDGIEVEMPTMPEPEVPDDDRDWLFDSRRDYVDQMAHYKAYKGEVDSPKAYREYIASRRDGHKPTQQPAPPKQPGRLVYDPQTMRFTES